MLRLLDKHGIRYLIIGGLAFIYHPNPRYTKDMDLWIDSNPQNVKRANHVLAGFGSPFHLNPDKKNEILQLEVAPNRIDFLLRVSGAKFQTAWNKCTVGRNGNAEAHWVGLDGLIRIKSRIDSPHHQEDVRILREVKKRRRKLSAPKRR